MFDIEKNGKHANIKQKQIENQMKGTILKYRVYQLVKMKTLRLQILKKVDRRIERQQVGKITCLMTIDAGTNQEKKERSRMYNFIFLY